MLFTHQLLSGTGVMMHYGLLKRLAEADQIKHKLTGITSLHNKQFALEI